MEVLHRALCWTGRSQEDGCGLGAACRGKQGDDRGEDVRHDNGGTSGAVGLGARPDSVRRNSELKGIHGLDLDLSSLGGLAGFRR